MFGALLVAGLALAQVAEVKPARFEGSVFPAQVQLSVVTQHIGAGLGLSWHVNELFAVQVSGFYNYVSGFTHYEDPLRFETTVLAVPALNVWGAFAGAEIAPLRGQSNLGRLSLVLNSSIGLGGTRTVLTPENASGPASYGDTGLRFLASIGAGFRFEPVRHFSVRLEIHDVIFSDRIESVNGCNAADLRAMDQALRNGMKPSSSIVSGGCRVETFEGTDPKTGYMRENDEPRANNLVKPPYSSRLVNNVTVQLGVSVQF